VFVYVDGGVDTLVPTPGCSTVSFNRRFGFDAANRIYYMCGSSLFVDATEIRTNVRTYLETLDDGRSILVELSATSGREDYVIIDDQGVEIARLAPHDTIDNLELLPQAVTSYGNVAYLLFKRIDATAPDDPDRELIAYRLGADSTFEPSWRRPIQSFGFQLSSDALLLLSDGSLIYRDNMSTTDDPFNARVFRRRLDSTTETVWLETDDPDIKTDAFTTDLLHRFVEP